MPGYDIFRHAVRYPGYRARGKPEVIYLVELLLDVDITHPFGVQGYHQGFHPLGEALPLGHNDRLEAAVPVTGDVNAGFTETGLYRFAPVPVTGVGMATFGVFVVTQVMVKLTLEHLLDTSFM